MKQWEDRFSAEADSVGELTITPAECDQESTSMLRLVGIYILAETCVTSHPGANLQSLSEETMPPITLLCLVRGDPDAEPFEVTIGGEQTIRALKDVVKEKRKAAFDFLPAPLESGDSDRTDPRWGNTPEP